MGLRFPIGLFGIVLCLASAHGVGADDAKFVARVTSADNSISRRGADGKFVPLKTRDGLAADELIVMLPDSEILSKNEAVAVVSRADFEGKSPLPLLETALTPSALRPTDTVDLEFTLDRGRVDLVNLKKSASATVRVRFQSETWNIVLEKPGSRVAVALCGRWAPGTRYVKNPPKGHEPILSAFLLVIHGEAEVGNGRNRLALVAPPGPSTVRWTSAIEAPLAADKLDKVPDWANTESESKLTLEIKNGLDRFRRFREENAETANDRMLDSASTTERRIGLIAAGAHDDLTRLAENVAETKDAEIWDFGITVIRHWLGRSANQEKVLFQFLVETRKYSPAQAETIIDLLNGFTEAETRRPETYDVLIEYLRHDNASIRKLAAWHLLRLVPKKNAIPFDPGAGKEEFEKLYRKWKDLIPSGKLPPGK